MALTKQYLKSKPVCKVTFSVPAEAATDSKEVALVGDFNEWNTNEATYLKKQKDGSYKAILELELGKEYQFRYLLDGQKWENDWAADKYVSAGVASEENSVVVV
ncbi:isoamylase early set domain-containing protein [Arundinibacter roseus]|uniref:Glycoside hydrolase n=1 Tax=Arundinibacter roseus TaxID=2070510 RepID=A0A4R4K8H4_9BACT|nr:isoamylase early set domain-containing protein [Arundinibacter roseus]TDB63984.1 glycoside hydrolase [Arundinibacter roseus]